MRSALILSRDRKVSPVGTYQPSRRRWIATVRNSLGLPAGMTCPGRTSFCDSCYGERSEQGAGVIGALRHNFDLLWSADFHGMTELLDEAVSRFERQADRHGLVPRDRVFRIHWDGDFFSEAYAWAWRATITAHPFVRFWAYTRSFTEQVDVVPILAPVPNLALYLSVDAENAATAAPRLEEYPSVRAALCADVEANAKQLLPGRRSVACPENVGRVALMTEGRGACVTCRLCPDALVDVRFLSVHPRQVAVAPVNLGPTRREATHGLCANPECHNPLPVSPGPGRPVEYCCTRCRQRAAYLRART